MTSNLMQNLNNNRERLDKFNRQLSTGKKFSRPSQDPTGVARSMDLNNTIENNEQYVKNVDQAIAWSQATDSAFNQAGKVLQRSRELAVRGANDSLSESDRKATAKEIDELRKSLTEIANTKHNDRYLFGGTKTKVKPYEDADSDYQGNQGAIKREISAGVEMQINMSGQFFKGALDKLKDISQDLKNGNTDEISNTQLGKLDKSIDNLLQKRAENGARQKRLEMTKGRLEEDQIKFKKLRSENEDVDIAKTIMNLKTSENVYKAALSSGSRIIQPSLADFLK